MTQDLDIFTRSLKYICLRHLYMPTRHLTKVNPESCRIYPPDAFFFLRILVFFGERRDLRLLEYFKISITESLY